MMVTTTTTTKTRRTMATTHCSYLRWRTKPPEPRSEVLAQPCSSWCLRPSGTLSPAAPSRPSQTDALCGTKHLDRRENDRSGKEYLTDT